MSEPAASQAALAELITRLRRAEIDWDAENIADLVWLSRYMEGNPLSPRALLPANLHPLPCAVKPSLQGIRHPHRHHRQRVGLYSGDPQLAQPRKRLTEVGFRFRYQRLQHCGKPWRLVGRYAL